MALAGFSSLLQVFAIGSVVLPSLHSVALATENDADMSLAGITKSLQQDLFTGLLTASMPIEPGRNGIQPTLHLFDWSKGGNGWVGMGWKPELGRVERQTRLGVSYSANDSLLGARPLRLLSTHKNFRIETTINQVRTHLE